MGDQLRFTVRHQSWTADGKKFSGGDHEVPYETRLARLLNHAHAAGAVELKSQRHVAPGDQGVQTQEEGEAAFAAAQGEWIPLEREPDGAVVPGTGRWSGGWHEGNLLAQEAARQ